MSLGAEEYRRTVKLQEDKLLSSKIEFLHRALLFDPLGEERVEKTAHIARTHVYERGETILQQGASAGLSAARTEAPALTQAPPLWQGLMWASSSSCGAASFAWTARCRSRSRRSRK